MSFFIWVNLSEFLLLQAKSSDSSRNRSGCGNHFLKSLPGFANDDQYSQTHGQLAVPREPQTQHKEKKIHTTCPMFPDLLNVTYPLPVAWVRNLAAILDFPLIFTSLFNLPQSSQILSQFIYLSASLLSCQSPGSSNVLLYHHLTGFPALALLLSNSQLPICKSDWEVGGEDSILNLPVTFLCLLG